MTSRYNYSRNNKNCNYRRTNNKDASQQKLIIKILLNLKEKAYRIMSRMMSYINLVLRSQNYFKRIKMQLRFKLLRIKIALKLRK